MKYELQYSDTCLPDYFRGDSRPWLQVGIWDNKGFTLDELKDELKTS